ncbi:hypothetical protein DMA11_08455 [Marinilabiliaceae bacterium JC017]|nr:hypothetical protein DMA11_08455 [Marinilabiliaceae bacterium JC017]
MKNKKGPSPERLFRVPMAVYTNMAVTAVERFLDIKRTSKKEDPIDQLLKNRESLTPEKKYFYWTRSKENLKVVNSLVNEGIWLEPETTEEPLQQAEANFDRFLHLVEALRDIRNKWSHYQHTEPVIEDELLRDTLIRLYNEATLSTAKKIPPKYTGQRALFYFKTSYNGSVELELPQGKKLKGDYTHHLTYTGYLFVTSLFLTQQEVNDFLTAMEQAPFSFEKLKERQAWREQFPDMRNPDLLKKQKERQAWRERFPDKEYPKHLKTERKHFFYARDVYTHFAIRGHRDTLTIDNEDLKKEKAFSLLEYLKRCPRERLVDRVAQNKQDELGHTLNAGYEIKEKDSSDPYLMPHQMVTIDGATYAVREKNKFLEYVVDFLTEEWHTLELDTYKIINWKWARHASATEVKQKNKNLTKDNPLERLPRHEKIDWQIPEKTEDRLNDRGEENGYSYYFEQDSQGHYTHALFKLTHTGIKKTVIGRLGSETLCTILENYFHRFPIKKTSNTEKKPANHEQRKGFFIDLFNSILNQIIDKTDTGRGNKPKGLVTPSAIAQRIAYLRSSWEKEHQAIEAAESSEQPDPFSPSKHHAKILYIVHTWNRMITFNQDHNLAHAKDYKGITGGKNGYQELVKQLSLMTDSNKREQAHDALLRTLNKLGNRKHISYYQAINSQIRYSGIMGNSGSPYPLKKKKTVNDLYLQARDYRLAMLDKLATQLEQSFDVDAWRPNAEMRWLGLRDSRTPQAAQNEQKQPQPKESGIYNVDNHYYSAVGIQTKQLKNINAGKIDNNNQLCNRHNEVLETNGNRLTIAAFYGFDGWAHWPRTDRQRLYAIKRQDALLAQLAYHYTLYYEDEYSNRTLDTLDFQKDQLRLCVEMGEEKLKTTAYITCFYRHFKQNRYRMIPRQVEKIMTIAVQQQLIPDPVMALNHLVRKKKDDLTQEEKFMLLSKEEQNMRAYEKMQAADKKLATIKEEYVLVPVPKQERDRFYLTELLTGYGLCRRAFIDALFKLERQVIDRYELHPNIKGYIEFNAICEALTNDQLISETQGEQLKQLRNCALHNDIPIGELLPSEKLVKRVTDKNKQQTGNEFIDFFGKGMQLTTLTLEKITQVSTI